ncbi:MAG TPA: alpha/beta hydrolase [Planctomycetota bacterium]|nr:alpha/beta hydrolase [Planctomycetota bacterium]
MVFTSVVAAGLMVASLALALLIRLALALAGRRPARYWRRAGLAHLALAPLYTLAAPVLFGVWLAGWVHTRGDESAYAGPRFTADGAWRLQSRESLRAERTAPPPPEVRAAERAAEVRLTASDGVPLRAFFVRARGAPRATAVLVHGLFRGGLELERPASAFRDLGCDVLMLEMRNHGGSGRTPTTLGLRERLDVFAAVDFVRSDPERARRPVVLFAVSLGTAAAALAAPDVPDLRGLALDAPMDALDAVAVRMLGEGSRRDRPGSAMPRWMARLTLAGLELRSGFRAADVHPTEALRRLSPDVPVLLIGGGDDDRMPPASVRALFEALPTRPELKALWIREGSDHGRVWEDDPEGYRLRLAALLDLAVR